MGDEKQIILKIVSTIFDLKRRHLFFEGRR